MLPAKWESAASVLYMFWEKMQVWNSLNRNLSVGSLDMTCLIQSLSSPVGGCVLVSLVIFHLAAPGYPKSFSFLCFLSISVFFIPLLLPLPHICPARYSSTKGSSLSGKHGLERCTAWWQHVSPVWWRRIELVWKYKVLSWHRLHCNHCSECTESRSNKDSPGFNCGRWMEITHP